MKTHLTAERVLDAPADVVYHLISDYKEHHRHGPQGFLPPQFTDLIVERGGVGTGTAIRFTMKTAGPPQTATANITELVPGRVLLEKGPEVQTTFTVEPENSRQARVRFDTVIDSGGLAGLMTRLFAPRLLRPIYADEFRRIEQHAKAHPALSPAVGAPAA